MPGLEVRNLSKRFGKTLAVDDLSFAVEAGRVTGFLGPNGAGKTTTMRALLGLVRPTSGEALVEGQPPAAMKEPLHTVGAALEATAFHPGRSGRNHLRVLAASAGIDRSRVEEVLRNSLLVLAKAPLTVNFDQAKLQLILNSGGFKNYWQVNQPLAKPADTASAGDKQK